MSCCSKPRQEKEAPSNSGSSCCAQPKKETVIHRKMTIQDILELFPQKAEKLKQEITNAGLHCIGCHAAVWETLENGMLSHGKSQEAIDTLVTRLNALLQEKVDLSTISITPRAAAKFLEIASEENKLGWGIRFSEELAGCNGFEYVLDFSEKADHDDAVFAAHGIEIHTKKALLSRLMGSEIDWKEGMNGTGFKISNPNSRSSCGCGSSHNY